MVSEQEDFPGVVFRLLNKPDLANFLQIRNSVSSYLHDSRKFTLEECHAWFSKTSDKYYLVELTTGELVGYFRTSNLNLQNSRIDIGLDIDPKFQGKRWAKKIYASFAKSVLSGMGIELIGLRVLKTNIRATNLYFTMGFAKVEETAQDLELLIQLSDLVRIAEGNLLSIDPVGLNEK